MEVREPKYIQVSATVTTTVRSKNAEAGLFLELIGLPSGHSAFRGRLEGLESWSTEFTTVSDDERALDGQCPPSGSFCWPFPMDFTMLNNAVDELRLRLRRRLAMPFD